MPMVQWFPSQISRCNLWTRTNPTSAIGHKGNLVILGLPVGTYALTVTKDGFDSYRAFGIVLRPALTSTIDAKLTVGGMTTSVSISDAQSQIETSTSETPNSVKAEQINTLPINGRSY
ncbi:MAG: carboxypeptidase-like regulatory domain-containing protein [Janthinobacterium lividum]